MMLVIFIMDTKTTILFFSVFIVIFIVTVFLLYRRIKELKQKNTDLKFQIISLLAREHNRGMSDDDARQKLLFAISNHVFGSKSIKGGSR